jgi:hypothetical protein
MQFMCRNTLGLFFAALLLVGCGGGSVARSVPAAVPTAAASSAFKIPANLSLGVPPPPPNFVPVRPSSSARRTSTTASHPAFFAGEASLGNGAYYLALPNGNVFGYYSYLSDQNYIYHFDMGYEYLYDAGDGQGIYFYDFTSAHWWYTGRNYPFPYLYDFSLGAQIYYYPDSNTNNPGHYTANPRYFYNFGTNQIVTVPAPVAAPASLTFTATGSGSMQSFSVSESGYSGSFTVAAAQCNGIASVAAGANANTYNVTPLAPGSCGLTLSDPSGDHSTLSISVTSTSIGGQ